jgi:hypothetical protein
MAQQKDWSRLSKLRDFLREQCKFINNYLSFSDTNGKPCSGVASRSGNVSFLPPVVLVFVNVVLMQLFNSNGNEIISTITWQIVIQYGGDDVIFPIWTLRSYDVINVFTKYMLPFVTFLKYFNCRNISQTTLNEVKSIEKTVDDALASRTATERLQKQTDDKVQQMNNITQAVSTRI